MVADLEHNLLTSRRGLEDERTHKSPCFSMTCIVG